MQPPDSSESGPRPGRGFSRPASGDDGAGRGFRRPQVTPEASAQVDYKALVEYVLGVISDHPEQARVDVVDRGRGTLALKVSMAESDLGRFIGRGGRNIEALRTLVRVAALREHHRVYLDLADQR
ncbi:MAG TPA: KH domain-containing protein [Candidatus Nitrosotalea sp.]|nr:KH domain-containing protein [Candidatus Nitrosotalea sp.]